MGSGFKDWTAGDVLTAADVDGYLMRQTVMTFASSSARDTALSGVLDEGMVAYLEDTNAITVYDGSNWIEYGRAGAWASWTPAITQSGSVSATNTRSRYTQVGKTVHASFDLSVTGSGSSSNAVTLTVPVTAAASAPYVGTAAVFDTSSGNIYPCLVRLSSTTALRFTPSSSASGSNDLGVAVFTDALASGDTIRGTITYEAA